MVITEISIIHHVGIVLFLLWLLNSFNCCHPIVYFVSLIYLYEVHERYSMRLRRKLQFEERKAANQRRILTDSETVRWLNHAVEKMWPICIEQIISQRIFLPIIPWFLQKYKPWTVKKAAVQSLYLGRRPPLFTDMRVLRETSDDDHLVLELGLNFLTADDMGAVLVAKLRKRLGFGMVAKMHLTGMHVEGKVLVGVKFLRSWPYIGRLRVCFAEPPYFQMIVKPLFHHGLDVTVVPGIAGWLDNLLAIAFEETLVEPNMLVVDLEKFVSPQPENWFSVDVKEAIAQVNVEVIEAAELKPADLNGLADPYLKGRLGPYRFSTQIQKKTLTPKWLEEFKVPICSWDSQCILEIEVRDKDRFVDDVLGKCSVNINELMDGQRHDMWLPLENVKTGRLHLAITVVKVNEEGKEQTKEVKIEGEKPDSVQSEMAKPAPSSTSLLNKSRNVADTFEAIDVEGQKETGIWVHHPGSETSQAWEPRKGKSRTIDTEIQARQSSQSSDTDSDDETKEGSQAKRGNIFARGFNKVFHRHHSKREDRSNSFKHDAPSPYSNVKPVNVKRVGVNLVMDDPNSESGKVEIKVADMKHTLSKKGLSKFNEKIEEGGVLESDSSDDESSVLSSFNDHSVGGIPISSTFISQAANDETEASEHVRVVSVESASKGAQDALSGQNVCGSTGNKEVSIEENLKQESLGERE